MRQAGHYHYTPEQQMVLKKARKLAWITILYLISVIALMMAVMGQSQAMRTAWVEDVLGLIPPVGFLVASYVSWRKPTRHFPYGYYHAVSIAFLFSALALLVMGALLCGESIIKLVTAEHPSIGLMPLGDSYIWQGYAMIAVLLYGTFPPIFLGRAKISLAKELHDKVLYTDADMNRADWMTAAAAIGGVIGIGFGFWWADALAALFISFDILRDGWRQTRDAITDLMDRAPKRVDGTYDDIVEQAEARLRGHEMIDDAEVRLREHGHLLFGEGYITLLSGHEVGPKETDRLAADIRTLNWRLQDFAIVVLPAEQDADAHQ